MRILVLPLEFPSEQQPGAGIFILRRTQALRDLGHTISVLRIVPHAPPIGAKWKVYRSIPGAYEIEGIPVRTIRALFPPRQIGMEYLPLQVHAAVQREIARFAPDVLHASFIIPCGQIAVRQSIPTVVTAHGGDAYRWPHKRPGLLRAAREAIRNATRVTAVSGYIGRCVQSIAQRDVDVIWNGGDERFFYPRDRAQSRAALSLPIDRFVIAFAGNLVRAKGVFDLIDAAARLNGASPILLMAGAGPEEAALRERAARAGVDVRLLGRLPQNGVAEMFGAADVVTLPSYNEGLPNVVCEAMLSGRAVVATTVGGIPEIVQHGCTGLLAGAGDVTGLHAALAQVAAAPEERARMEQLALEFAKDKLTWRVSARRYDEVLRQAATAR